MFPVHWSPVQGSFVLLTDPPAPALVEPWQMVAFLVADCFRSRMKEASLRLAEASQAAAAAVVVVVVAAAAAAELEQGVALAEQVAERTVQLAAVVARVRPLVEAALVASAAPSEQAVLAAREAAVRLVAPLAAVDTVLVDTCWPGSSIQDIADLSPKWVHLRCRRCQTNSVLVVAAQGFAVEIACWRHNPQCQEWLLENISSPVRSVNSGNKFSCLFFRGHCRRKRGKTFCGISTQALVTTVHGSEKLG